jgi:hypothetical protein
MKQEIKQRGNAIRYEGIHYYFYNNAPTAPPMK